MNDMLSEYEQKVLLGGVSENAPPIDTEKFKSMWIKYFMNNGNSYEAAKKIVAELCEKHGIK